MVLLSPYARLIIKGYDAHELSGLPLVAQPDEQKDSEQKSTGLSSKSDLVEPGGGRQPLFSDTYIVLEPKRTKSIIFHKDVRNKDNEDYSKLRNIYSTRFFECTIVLKREDKRGLWNKPAAIYSNRASFGKSFADKHRTDIDELAKHATLRRKIVEKLGTD